jgi:hypothetical protein
MDAGTPRQQARNRGLEQRVSPDLELRVSPCPSPPKILPEFLPSAGSRWILIPREEWVSSRPMKLREAIPCLNWEHLAQRVATLEDKLLQTIQRRPRTSAPAAEDLQKD